MTGKDGLVSYPLTERDRRQLARKRTVRTLTGEVEVGVPDAEDEAEDSALAGTRTTTASDKTDVEVRQSLQVQAKLYAGQNGLVVQALRRSGSYRDVLRGTPSSTAVFWHPTAWTPVFARHSVVCHRLRGFARRRRSGELNRLQYAPQTAGRRTFGVSGTLAQFLSRSRGGPDLAGAGIELPPKRTTEGRRAGKA